MDNYRQRGGHLKRLYVRSVELLLDRLSAPPAVYATAGGRSIARKTAMEVLSHGGCTCCACEHTALCDQSALTEDEKYELQRLFRKTGFLAMRELVRQFYGVQVAPFKCGYVGVDHTTGRAFGYQDNGDRLVVMIGEPDIEEINAGVDVVVLK